MMHIVMCLGATDSIEIVSEPWLSVWRNIADVSQPDEHNHVLVPAVLFKFQQN